MPQIFEIHASKKTSKSSCQVCIISSLCMDFKFFHIKINLYFHFVYQKPFKMSSAIFNQQILEVELYFLLSHMYIINIWYQILCVWDCVCVCVYTEEESPKPVIHMENCARPWFLKPSWVRTICMYYTVFCYGVVLTEYLICICKTCLLLNKSSLRKATFLLTAFRTKLIQ